MNSAEQARRGWDGRVTAGPSDRDLTDQPPVSTLRGAGVDVDARLIGRVLVGVVLAGLAALSGALFVAGASKNAQIDELRLHGVAIEVTVTKCLGLLGGSGSNAAGYACNGTYTFEGHHFAEAIPGNTLRAPGSRVAAVASPSDPGLFSPTSTLSSERASGDVYVIPAVLLGVLVLLAAMLFVRARRRRPGEPAA